MLKLWLALARDSGEHMNMPSGWGCAPWQCSWLDWHRKKSLQALDVLKTTWNGNWGILYNHIVIPKRMVTTPGEHVPCFHKSLPPGDGSSLMQHPPLPDVKWYWWDEREAQRNKISEAGKWIISNGFNRYKKAKFWTESGERKELTWFIPQSPQEALELGSG